MSIRNGKQRLFATEIQTIFQHVFKFYSRENKFQSMTNFGLWGKVLSFRLEVAKQMFVP